MEMCDDDRMIDFFIKSYMEGNKCSNILWYLYWRTLLHPDPHIEIYICIYIYINIHIIFVILSVVMIRRIDDFTIINLVHITPIGIAFYNTNRAGFHTLSGRTGKVVASPAAVARSIPGWGCTDLYYARGAQGVLPMRVGGATINWIYRLRRHCSLLGVVDCNYRSSPLGYFSRLLQVVDDWPHILW